MAEPMVDQMTRFKIKLLEKRLENERGNCEGRTDTPTSTGSFAGQTEALHRALKRKRALLQRLQEQQLLDDWRRPRTWAGTRTHQRPDARTPPAAPPIHIYPPAAPAPAAVPSAPPPEPPRIIQHTVPQQPATIIQQLPQQQPLIAQIPPPQTTPYRSGSIKEDMVELMLMQNAQMHQIIMHNMMLKAIPPMAISPAGGAVHNSPATSPAGQDNYLKSKGRAIYHHHHYGTTLPPLPPIGYSVWPPLMPSGQGGVYQPSVQHVTSPVALPPLNTMAIDGFSSRVPL